jgi:hypothetical protein
MQLTNGQGGLGVTGIGDNKTLEVVAAATLDEWAGDEGGKME